MHHSNNIKTYTQNINQTPAT